MTTLSSRFLGAAIFVACFMSVVRADTVTMYDWRSGIDIGHKVLVLTNIDIPDASKLEQLKEVIKTKFSHPSAKPKAPFDVAEIIMAKPHQQSVFERIQDSEIIIHSPSGDIRQFWYAGDIFEGKDNYAQALIELCGGKQSLVKKRPPSITATRPKITRPRSTSTPPERPEPIIIPQQPSAEAPASTRRLMENARAEAEKLMHTLEPVVSDIGINDQDADGDTPLHHAARANKKYDVWALLELGANVNAQNNKGDTPLHVAATLGNVESIFYLLGMRSEAAKSLKEKYYFETAPKEFLIQPTQYNNDGLTALHCAAIHGKLDAVKAMVFSLKGTQAEKESKAGLIPRQAAEEAEQNEVVKFFDNWKVRDNRIIEKEIATDRANVTKNIERIGTLMENIALVLSAGGMAGARLSGWRRSGTWSTAELVHAKKLIYFFLELFDTGKIKKTQLYNPLESLKQRLEKTNTVDGVREAIVEELAASMRIARPSEEEQPSISAVKSDFPGFANCKLGLAIAHEKLSEHQVNDIANHGINSSFFHSIYGTCPPPSDIVQEVQALINEKETGIVKLPNCTDPNNKMDLIIKFFMETATKTMQFGTKKSTATHYAFFRNAALTRTAAERVDMLQNMHCVFWMVTNIHKDEFFFAISLDDPTIEIFSLSTEAEANFAGNVRNEMVARWRAIHKPNAP